MSRRRRDAVEAPADLESWIGWATQHGAINENGRGWDTSRVSEWVDARIAWAQEFGGFPDGEACVSTRAPSEELLSFPLWCQNRGIQHDPMGAAGELLWVRDDAYRQWRDARAAHAGAHGWHGGREVRRSTEKRPWFLDVDFDT